MAQEGNGVASGEIGYEVIADLGYGVVIAKVDPNTLQEQDVNARIMDRNTFKRLTDNIKKRGGLESLPYCALTPKGIEIISGHHRIKASREAGLKSIPVLLDTSGLTRSQIAAKQLAHNAIAGFDDKDQLRQIAHMIKDVDDMLESAMSDEFFKDIEAKASEIAPPKMEFDWKTITFAFLPHQVADLGKLCDAQTPVDVIGVAPLESFKPFVDALQKTQKFQDVKSVGTAVYYMVCAALEKLAESGYDGAEDVEWVPISKVLGGAVIPAASAEIIEQALGKMLEDGDIGVKNRWQALEYMAAEYLGGV